MSASDWALKAVVTVLDTILLAIDGPLFGLLISIFNAAYPRYSLTITHSLTHALTHALTHSLTFILTS